MTTGITPLVPANARTDSEDTFADGLATVARRILFGARDLSSAEREFLHDLTRSEERYPMKSLRRLLALSAKCAKPEDAEAFPEFLRTLIVTQRNERLSAMTAFEQETESQGQTDIAQFAFAKNPCRSNKERVLDALRAQLARTRKAIDAVLAA